MNECVNYLGQVKPIMSRLGKASPIELSCIIEEHTSRREHFSTLVLVAEFGFQATTSGCSRFFSSLYYITNNYDNDSTKFNFEEMVETKNQGKSYSSRLE